MREPKPQEEGSGYIHFWSRCLHRTTSGIGPPDSSQLREPGAPQKLAQPASLVHLFPGITSGFLWIKPPNPARSSCFQQDLYFGCHPRTWLLSLLSCGLPQGRVRPQPPPGTQKMLLAQTLLKERVHSQVWIYKVPFIMTAEQQSLCGGTSRSLPS